MRKTIFVVDDNDTNLSMAKEALKEQYKVLTLPSAEKMFALMDKVTPDLILLDIEMPDMDGFQALRQLKNTAGHADIPVIFLTGMTDAQIEVRGFQLGAIDFVTKPFSAPVLINRIRTHLDVDDLVREKTVQLQHKTTQLQALQNGIVFVLADIVEYRDRATGGHMDRTDSYLRILLDSMLEHNVYAKEIGNADIDLLISSARLHDVGKITISDVILNKPGKLTDEEFDMVKTHAAQGVYIIDRIVSRTEDGEFLRNARMFAGYHHERWDGRGYPYGLAKEEIPLLGRIMAIVDVYDALVAERPYKKPFPPDEAIQIIMDCSGTQFDPLIVELFYEARDKLMAVDS